MGLAGRDPKRLRASPASPTCSFPLRLSPSGKSDGPEVSLRTSLDCVKDSIPRPAAHSFQLTRLLVDMKVYDLIAYDVSDGRLYVQLIDSAFDYPNGPGSHVDPIGCISIKGRFISFDFDITCRVISE